jgi:hypothetical protein
LELDSDDVTEHYIEIRMARRLCVFERDRYPYEHALKWLDAAYQDRDIDLMRLKPDFFA